MKKFISIFILFLSLVVSAEYQAFNYTASIKRLEPDLLTNGFTVTSDTLKGILVTVCCYPCGANMGKGYPSWLYIVRGKDKTKTLWKIPVQVDGGIFGKKLDAWHIYDTWIDYFLDHECDYGSLKPLVKPADRAWVKIYFKCDMVTKIIYLNKKVCGVYDYGLLGYKSTFAELHHSGFGTAGIKYNYAIFQYLNPYIKQASGTISGTATYPHFSLDPSNLTMYDNSPIYGSFTIRFNNSITEKLRGTAEWSELDSRVFKLIKYKELMEAPDIDENWELWN